MKKIFAATAFAAFLYLVGSGQNGFIAGKITENAGGKMVPVPFANVAISGTTMGVTTDIEGNYSLSILPGTYDLVISFVGYLPDTLKNITVLEGETKSASALLKQNVEQLEEVVIEGSAKKESMVAMLILQKNSINVADGISADIIRKTPDKSSSDVLKRVSGTTIQDNKFVIIRGLNDRYNAAYINGAPLPSSESDRKAFSFDIFPSALLDNIIIVKSATPDQPADFAGGIVLVNTRSIPETNIQSVSVSGTHNTLTTFQPFVTYKGGSYDYIGIDDGSRDIPEGIPATEDFRAYTPSEKAEVAKLMPNDWALNTKPAIGPSSGLQYSLGNASEIVGNNFGSLFALTYNNSYTINRSIRREFEESIDSTRPQQVFELTDSSFSNTILAGAIANFSYEIGKNNRIGIKNLVNINSENKVVLRNGIRDYSQDIQTWEKGSLRSFTENKLYSGQLSGEHFIPAGKIKITWIGGYSNIERNIPDLRRMLYTKTHKVLQDPLEPEPQFEAAIPTSGTSPSMGGNIFYSNTLEKIYSGRMDIGKPLDFIRTEIKAGAFYQQRDRDFGSRQFGFSRYSKGSKVPFDKTLLSLPEDSIFAPGNLGEIEPWHPANGSPAKKGRGGFKLEEATKLNDSYHASSVLYAGYLMLDNKITKKLRVIWGARMESYNQALQSFEDDGDTINVDTTVVDYLPSGSIIYSLTEKSNLRLSYAQTLSRPEFRELAPFGFFDYVTFYSVRGNPELKRALVHNYDFRYELFPSGGQVLSASLFYKKFMDAIEQVNRADVPRELYYTNVPLANNYGIELEYRINLGIFKKESPGKFLTNTSVYSNIALIKSEVDISSIPGAIGTKRALQGQSPYIVNAGVQYNDPVKEFNISVSLNKVGRRIAVVGNTQEPDIYENPRTVADFQIAKTFFKRLEVKLNLRDALAQDLIFYQDRNNNKKMDKDTDNILAETNYGQNISIGLSYKIQ